MEQCSSREASSLSQKIPELPPSDAGDHIKQVESAARKNKYFTVRARLVTKNFHPKIFASSFGHMHGALNIVKKIKLIAQFECTRRDKSFKPY